MKCEPVFYKFIGMWRLYAYLRNMLLWILGNVKVVWTVRERNTFSVSAMEIIKLINRNAIISKGKSNRYSWDQISNRSATPKQHYYTNKGSVSHSRIYIAYKLLIKLIQFQTEKRDAKVIMNCGYQLACWKEVHAAYFNPLKPKLV
jgi:hypothetical protein